MPQWKKELAHICDLPEDAKFGDVWMCPECTTDWVYRFDHYSPESEQDVGYWDT